MIAPVWLVQTEKWPALPSGTPATKVFSQPPESSSTPFESASCRQVVSGLHVFLSYRFFDGMIHDSLVRQKRRGVAPPVKLRAAHISYLNRNPKYLDSWSAPAT